jgi:ComF family protein
LSNFIQPILNNCVNIAQSLLPQDCLLCGASSGSRLLCAACLADLPRHDKPSCPVCALPTPLGETCGACLAHPPAFGRTLAAFDYAFPVDALLHAFKYGGRLPVAEALADPLAELAAQHPLPDGLVPMPLHPSRLRERGFNQAMELAHRLSRRLGVKTLPNLCQRQRDTSPQADLPWKERKKNIRGAFDCRADLRGRRLAIVDDVMTTGATVGELASRLKQAGAEVEVWVVARTLEKPHV